MYILAKESKLFLRDIIYTCVHISNAKTHPGICYLHICTFLNIYAIVCAYFHLCNLTWIACTRVLCAYTFLHNMLKIALNERDL